MNGSWTQLDIRDEVIDYVRTWADKTELKARQLVGWIGIDRSKYYQWRQRYGQVNEHNAWIPRDHWLAEWEKQAILAYFQNHPLEGYRRLTYMLMDADVVAVSPASVYRVLQAAGLLGRIISDNGPPFIARDFKEFIALCGMTHVRTSPYYPQSNGKLERYHRTIKADCIRPGTPLSLEDARRIVERFVTQYNTVRLHSAIQYVTPADKLAGRAEAILAGREAKLAAAREARKARRQRERIPA